MGKVLTVVVPSYNVEAYLEECLESFVAPEIMDDIEVLIVDDESSDDTADIAQRYEQRYPQTFRLIQKKNGGHGSTINTGLREATGEYYKCVDGDDWVDTGRFIKLVEMLKLQAAAGASDPTKQADIVATDYTWINHTTHEPEKRQENLFENIEFGRMYQFEVIVDKTLIDMHAMTVRTECLRAADEPLDEHTFYVDMEFVAFPIPFVERVWFMEDEVYQYRLGLPGQSMSIAKMQKNELNHLCVLKRLHSFYKKHEATLSEAKKNYIAGIIGSMLGSQIKIYVSYPLGSGKRKEAMKIDNWFRRENPRAYERVLNPAVKLLRKSNYLLFPAAVVAFKGRRNSY